MLTRLLGYLEREQSHFPIIVLDSSHDADRARNAARIAQSPLAVRIAASDASADPYVSIRAGLKLVTTPYCSICADDDVILLPALHECLSVLEADQTVSAAHGLYFTFSEAKFFDLLSIANRGPSVDVDDPLLRVRQLFAHYEPLLHAVHRTAVLQDVFARVGEVQTTLGVELRRPHRRVGQGAPDRTLLLWTRATVARRPAAVPAGIFSRLAAARCSGTTVRSGGLGDAWSARVARVHREP
jgi:glycosyltransferase domain-containing protein